jgi:TolA-binding protein
MMKRSTRLTPAPRSAPSHLSPPSHPSHPGRASAIAAAVALALLANTHAATLGDAQLSSALGNPLSVRIRVNAAADETLQRDCFQVSLHEGDSNGIARRAALDFAADKTGGWLHVMSDAALNEPINQLSIRLRCGTNAAMVREYTLFLDPPVQSARAERNAAATVSGTTAGSTPNMGGAMGRAPALPPGASLPAGADPVRTQDYVVHAGDSINSLAQRRYPARPDTARLYAEQLMRQNSGTIGDPDVILSTGMHLKMPSSYSVPADPLADANGTWTVQANESLVAIVRKVYPDQVMRKKALFAMLRKLNPGLTVAKDAPLPVGLKLKMPTAMDGGETASTVSKPLSAKVSAPAVAPLAKPATKPAAPAKKDNDRLIVSSGAAATPPKNEAEKLEQRESALTDQLSEQTAQMNEAQYRIEKLEKRLTWLMEQIARREREEKAARDKQAAALAQDQHDRWWNLAMAAGLGAAMALLLSFALRRFGQRRSESLRRAEELAESLAFDVPQDSQLWQDLHAAEVAAPPLVPAQRPVAPPSAADMDVIYLSDAASEAALLAAHGQYDRAVALLQDEITARPTQVVNWMQLLEIHHGHRNADAFVRLANHFRQQFASQALWSKVSRMGQDLAPDAPLFQPPSEKVPAVAADSGDTLNDVLDSLPGPATHKGPALESPAPVAPLAPPTTPTARFGDTIAMAPWTPASTTPPVPAEPVPAPAPTAEAEPLMFELELPATEATPSAPPALVFENLIDVPPAYDPPSPTAHVAVVPEPGDDTPLGQARQLIHAGERESGSKLLEHIMLSGNLDERIAAAELLVLLTAPSELGSSAA